MGVLSWLGIQPKQFRYTLTVGSTSYILPNAPIGWEESILRWSRSDYYYGMIRSFTVPLKFVLDGAWILRTQFYTKGLKANTSLLIEELVPETWAYQTVFEGDMDYSTFQDSLNEVSCTVMEGGITAQIKAYENVKYTIPLNVPEAIDLELTPLKLQENAEYIFDLSDARYNKAILGLNLIINEVQALGVASSYDVDFSNVNTNPPVPLDAAWDNKYFFKAKIATSITIAGNVKGSVKGGTGNNQFTLSVYKYSAGVGNYIGTIVDQTINGATTINFDQDFSITADLLVDDILYLITTVFPIGAGGDISAAGFIITEGELTLEYFTGSPATFCKAISAKYLYEQLIKKMNGGTAYPVQSTLLDTWDDLYMTSGNAIRQLADPMLITSFKDFFTSINAVLNTGFGIESGKAVLENKSYFFKSGLQAADVGENKSFELELYEAYIYNSVKIGYADQKFSTIIDNRDETNSTQVYSLPITRVQKELDLLSIYRADAYGIEDVRITPVGSSNNNNDNDVFMIKVVEPVSGEYQPERTEGYISLSGVTAAETYYNYDLSPKRNLERHGDYLHSILDKYDANSIIFESALKNSAMSVVYLNGQRTTESSNVSIGTLPAKIFLPYLITIITKLPKNMMELMTSFPTGYIKSSFLDNNQKGFTIDTSVDVSKNGERELKLLLTPDNSLENLIH